MKSNSSKPTDLKTQIALVEKYRKTLLNRMRKNMHEKFFQKDKQLEYINLEIVTEHETKLIPFRNMECTEPFCIYDIEELVEKYQNSGFTENYDMICTYCDNPIRLKNFYYDYTLGEGINALWKKYNSDKIQCREARQDRSGNVEKGIPGQSLKTQGDLDGGKSHQKVPGSIVKKTDNSMANITRNTLDDRLDQSMHHSRNNGYSSRVNNDGNYVPSKPRINVVEDTQVNDQSFMYSWLPLPRDFSKQEFSNLYYQFSRSRGPGGQNATPFQIPITKLDFDNVINDFQTAPSIIGFFLKYLRNYNKMFNQTRAQEDYMLPFIVEKNDRYSQAITFKYLKGYRNQFKNSRDDFFSYVKRIVNVFKYDDRWILSFVDLTKGKCTLIDLLASDLSKASKEEIYGIVKAYTQQEFNIKPTSLTFYDREKTQTYSDCGLFIIAFLMAHYLDSKELEKISIGDAEKNQAKKVLPWLILKLHYFQDNPTQESNNNSPEPVGQKSHHMQGSHTFNQKSLYDIKKASSPSNKQISIVADNQARNSAVTIYNDPYKGRLDAIKMSKSSPDKSAVNDNKKDNKDVIKLKRSDLTKMLIDLKDELLKQLDGDNPDDVSAILGEEGLFNKGGDKETLTKDQLKSLLRKLENKKIDKDPDAVKKVSYEEYVEQYNKYQQEAMNMANMLTYFQQYNPALYRKAAEEIQSKIEDKLLEQNGMLHLKYPKPVNIEEPQDPLVLPDNTFKSRSHHSSVYGTQDFRSSSHLRKLPPISPDGITHHNMPNSFNAGVVQKGNSSPNTPFLSHTKSPNDLHEFLNQGRIMSESINMDKESRMFGFGGPYNKGVEPKPKKQIVAKRYGIEISREEYLAFKTSDKLSSHIVNFYLAYLKEKQEYLPVDMINNFRLRIYYFSPDFYHLLTDGEPLGLTINYNNVKKWTNNYSGFGQTIFDAFDKVIFVVRAKEQHWATVYLDNEDKKAYLFDTKRTAEKSPINNPILFNISQYIEKENQDKANRKINLAKWQFIYGDVMHPEDPQDSALVVLRLIHNLHRGTLNAHFSEEELKAFKKSLVDLILKIGVTDNRSGELGTIERYPL